MERSYHHIRVDRQGPILCAHFIKLQLDELELDQLSAEIARLVDEEGCHKLVLSLGPGDPQFLFSVFLARLINLQKRLEASGGRLGLTEVSPSTRNIFQAAGLERFFHFYSDPAAAVEAFTASA